jgi:cellulose synthase/poly-beta-1,6-N-acetylglucosamine synthase-like glycosyltransferase
MVSFHSIVLALYVLIGPVAWGGMFFGYFLAAARMKRLGRMTPLPQVLPTVSVLIPAKDEGAEIEQCIRSVLALDYPAFDILAIDDRSVDDTGAVMDRLAVESKNLRIIHIPAGGLPAGWLGKCHALARGAETVSSDWILFVDSDVRLEPASLSIALSNALQRDYDAVSILTRLDCRSFWERLVLPLAGALWAVMFTVAGTNDDGKKTSAAANGQFFLVRRAVYEAVGGHGAVRSQITEDVELMRRLKSAGYRVRLCFGDHLATTRMHATLRQMMHGWGRIYSGTSRRRGGRILLAMLLLVVMGLSVYPALVLGAFHLPLLAAASAHWILMSIYLATVYGQTGQPKRNAFLFPLGCAVLLVLLGYALRMCRTGRVVWRDTRYEGWEPARSR